LNGTVAASRPAGPRHSEFVGLADDEILKSKAGIEGGAQFIAITGQAVPGRVDSRRTNGALWLGSGGSQGAIRLNVNINGMDGGVFAVPQRA